MKTLLRSGLVLCTMLLLTGCISNQSAQKAPHADLTKLKSFYVPLKSDDKHALHEVIAGQLTALGYTATAGSTEAAPAPVDAVVTYQAKWWWDITVYLMQLDLQIRDPKTNVTQASGTSTRSSMVRKSPESMAREVLEKIFAE